MFTPQQEKELKEHLEKAQNPVFYYDNDADGLCSYLLLRRYLGRGKGVAVKSYPDLNAQYASKAKEFNSDYVFVLDKPLLSQEFVKEIDEMQIPLVWIDHHNVAGNDLSGGNMHIYNPTKNEGEYKSSEPVTFLVYSLLKKKEDIWIAMMGCIADHYMPDFVDEFKEEYNEYWSGGLKKPFDAYYKSEIGKIARAVGLGLKDSITNVVLLQEYLISCRNPGDVLAEVKENEFFRNKYYELKKKYDSLIEKAEQSWFGNLLFFDYAGETSMSADVANFLSYKYSDKYIAIAYVKGVISNISLRGKGVKSILERVLKQFEESSGGGHEDAVGARVKTQDLAKFREALEKEVN